MPEEYISKPLCDQICGRLEDEDKRQNERIKRLENSIDEINQLARSTEKLAVTMQQMLEEQKEQGSRISKLEKRDGEKWRKVVETAITVVISTVIGFALANIGL